MTVFLEETFDLDVSVSTVSRSLKRLNYNKKRLRRTAAQRSQLLRDDFWARMAQYTPDRLAFLDETACCEKTAQRRTGWSLRGVAPAISEALGRSERFSILPMYTMQGYIGWRIVKGSFNRERFLDFVREVVVPCIRRDWTVIIFDNASIHHSEVSLPLPPSCRSIWLTYIGSTLYIDGSRRGSGVPTAVFAGL